MTPGHDKKKFWFFWMCLCEYNFHNTYLIFNKKWFFLCLPELYLCFDPFWMYDWEISCECTAAPSVLIKANSFFGSKRPLQITLFVPPYVHYSLPLPRFIFLCLKQSSKRNIEKNGHFPPKVIDVFFCN